MSPVKHFVGLDSTRIAPKTPKIIKKYSKSSKIVDQKKKIMTEKKNFAPLQRIA